MTLSSNSISYISLETDVFFSSVAIINLTRTSHRFSQNFNRKEEN
nr:MAG TPA: hypothetical protein [Caudoviricetes sp.]